MLTYAYSIYALHHNTSTGRTDDHGRFIQYQRDIDLFYLERQSESIESFLEFIRSMTRKHTEYFTIIYFGVKMKITIRFF